MRTAARGRTRPGRTNRLRQRHVHRQNHHLTERPSARALAANIGFVPQAQVNNAPLAAAHGVKVERAERALDVLRCRDGTQPQFLDPQGAIVVRIEAQQLVMLGGHVQRFHGEELKRQQQFGFVREQHVHVGPGEFHQ